MKSSFTSYSATAAAGVWSLGWAVTAICAINHAIIAGTGSAAGNAILPIAFTLFGSWATYRTFLHKGKRIIATSDTGSSLPKPESWYRRHVVKVALGIWCVVGVIWNFDIFATTIRAAAKGQTLTVMVQVPLSIIGYFLLFVMFASIGMFLDFLFRIKGEDESALRAVPDDK